MKNNNTRRRKKGRGKVLPGKMDTEKEVIGGVK